MASYKRIAGTRVKDRVGDRCGKLVAEKPAGRNSRGEMRWLYRCDCGGETVQYPHAAAATANCGCETASKLHRRFLKHGASGTLLYKAYKGMIYRCHSRSNHAFKHYGARGISVCKRWRDSFEDFVSDMGDRPAGATIERIDNSGNYEPGNCVWATRKTQQRNRRVNQFVTVNGETMCVSAWAERVGANRATIVGRLKRGWSAADAVLKPAQRKYRNSRGQK